MTPDRAGAVSEDARLELAMAAASAERSNRPRHLLLGACVVFLIALIYLFVAMGSRSAATGKLQRAGNEIASLERVVADLHQAGEVGLGAKYAPSNLVVPYLEGLAKRKIGIPDVEVTQPQGSESTSGPEGFMQRSYKAKIAEQDPALLLKWVDEALRAQTIGENEIEPVPGLEVSSLKLTPGHEDAGKVLWNLEVIFKRWERR